MIRLEEENGYLYIVLSITKQDEPVRLEHWYPLGLPAVGFKHSYGAEKIGQRLAFFSPGVYVDADLHYHLPRGGRTLPDFTRELEIPPPKQRGKALPVEYRWGCWWKKTKRSGWVECTPAA